MQLRILISLDDDDARVDVRAMLERGALVRVPAIVEREINSVGEGDCYSAGLSDRNGVTVGRLLLYGDEYELTADDNEVYL